MSFPRKRESSNHCLPLLTEARVCWIARSRPGNDRCSGKDLGADGTVDPSGEMILGIGATKRSGDLAILEQDQGRDGAHVIGARCTWVLVDVELLDAHLAVKLFGDLFQNWPNLPAWAAPLCPEVDDHRS